MAQDAALEAALTSLAECDREAIKTLNQLGELLQCPPAVPRRVHCQFEVAGGNYQATLTEAQGTIVERVVAEYSQDPRPVTKAVRQLLSLVQAPAGAALTALERALRAEKAKAAATPPAVPSPVGACIFNDGTCQQLTEVDCHQQPGWSVWQPGPCPPAPAPKK
jgi:hypothetical protein